MHHFGKKFANVLFDSLCDLLRVLVWNEPRGKFCERFGWNYGFGAFASVTTPNAVQLKRRTNPKLFDDGKTLFAAITRCADGGLKRFFAPWQRVECFALGFREFGYIVIETGDSNVKVLVVQLGEKFGEDSQWIWDCTAIDPRMQVALRTGQFNL